MASKNAFSAFSPSAMTRILLLLIESAVHVHLLQVVCLPYLFVRRIVEACDTVLCHDEATIRPGKTVLHQVSVMRSQYGLEASCIIESQDDLFSCLEMEECVKLIEKQE